MKPIVLGLFGFAMAGSIAFGQNTAAAQTGDQAFVDMVAQIDMTEAHLGQMAADQGTSQAVKDYGQMMVTDHTADYKQITAVATKAGLTVPKGLDAQHDKMIAPFEKLKGAAFDRKYAQTMAAGHKAAITAFNKEATDGQNADLKSYATATLPTLEKHKSAADELLKPAKKGS